MARGEAGRGPGPRVAVITKMTLENAGNQALSSVLIDWLEAALPEAEIRAVDRYPRWMTQFRCAPLRRWPERAVTLFDGMVEHTLARLRPDPAGPLSREAKSAGVSFHAPSRRRSAPVAFAQKLQLRTRLARAGLYGKAEARRALNTLAWADSLVWNAAGEFYPTEKWDDALRLLILAAAAKRLGAAVAIVNHSLETSDPVLERIVAHVFGKAELIVVRGQGSYRKARAIGVPARILAEAPDMVFLLAGSAGAGSGGPVPPGSIALAINRETALRGRDEWARLLDGLTALGRPLVFISNCALVDNPLGEAWHASHGVEVAARQLGYAEMMDALGAAGLLVSSRLHASIFAMCRATPVLTIEPNAFKLAEVTAGLDRPLPTEDLARPGWSDRLVARARQALRERERLSREAVTDASAQKARVEQGYERLAGLIGGHRKTP